MEKELITIKKDEEKKIGKKLEKNLYEFYNDIIINRLQNKRNIKQKNDYFLNNYIYDIKNNELSSLAQKAKEKIKKIYMNILLN